jgi:hypothetical protein
MVSASRGPRLSGGRFSRERGRTPVAMGGGAESGQFLSLYRRH